MPQYDDYHRTVVGYHGTGLSAALRIVNRVEGFRWSERDYDWLGRGIYFWEYAPKQALNFARIRQRQFQEKQNKTPEDERRAKEPLAVVACMIRLGYCLDLTEPENLEEMGQVFEAYQQSLELANEPLPKNSRKFRKLDRAVFEYAYAVFSEAQPKRLVDTTRGIYIPTDGSRRIWPGSWISRDTHIQLCVRNPASLLGTWLQYPTKLEVKDVVESLRPRDRDAVVDPDDPAGDGPIPGHVEA
jgi:hypothetical protein